MKSIIFVFLIFVLGGCTYSMQIPETSETPKLMPRGSTYTDLISLPQPRGKILVSVYDFRDQTGQYKPQPNSNFSTAVPQGGTSLLTTALIDSQWFVPLEREGLQNLLTERKIIRAAQKKDKIVDNHGTDLTSLSSANIVIEGGIVAYDSNIVTGGAGGKYLGIGGSGQYRTDQVTVNLRAVDVRTGQVLLSVTTSKTISSHEIGFGVFKFIDSKGKRSLLEVEMGYSHNEPVNIAVMSAIDAAVIHLIVKGMKYAMWTSEEADVMSHPIISRYATADTDIL